MAAASAFWLVWLAEVVLAEVEAQHRLQPIPQGGNDSGFKGVVTRTCYSLSFFELLSTLAFSASVDRTQSKYAAFSLIKRVLAGVRAVEPVPPPQLAEFDVDHERRSEWLETFVRAAQMQRVLELFGVRYRKEIGGRVFVSGWMLAMFELLESHWESNRTNSGPTTEGALDRHSSDEENGSSIELCIEAFSSTHATISWRQRPKLKDRSAGALDEQDQCGEGSVLSLNVFQHPDDGIQSDWKCVATHTHIPRVLPLKGSYTIRSLAPDTRYVFRLSSIETPTESAASAPNKGAATGLVDAVPPQASDDAAAPDSSAKQSTLLLNASALVVLQTPPEPVFQLDGDSMGKNLAVFNRNLSVKNLVNKKWHTVRAAAGFDEGVHQWHVRIDTCVSKNIFIGVCTQRASLDNYVGSDGYGYGFLANKAVWHNKSKLHPYGEIFKQGDVLQVTLDCNAKTLAFSHNGEYLGIAATNLHASSGNGTDSAGEACKWYPALSLYNKDDQLTIVPPSSTSKAEISQPEVTEWSQNASVLSLLDAAEHVKAYAGTNTASHASIASRKRLLCAAYADFKAWREREVLFREVELGRLIRIDSSATATRRFGLARGDSVFTSRGQATVLGVHNHELWYERETDATGDTSALGAWSLHVCKQMLASPSEFPVHRDTHNHHYSSQHIYTQSAVADVDEQESGATAQFDITRRDDVSYEVFAHNLERWTALNSYEAFDEMIVELLNDTAASRGVSDPHGLSFSDVSAELILGGDTAHLLLVRLRESLEAAGGSSERELRSLVLARVGLLLFVNRSLYSITRIVVGEPMRAAALPQALRVAPNSRKQPNARQRDGLEADDEGTAGGLKWVGTAASAVVATDFLAAYAATLSSSQGEHCELQTASALTARMLFKAQKERLVAEALQQAATPTLNMRGRDHQSESSEFAVLDEDFDPSDLPRVRVRYPEPPCRPFWSATDSQRAHRRAPRVVSQRSQSESLFAQISQQLGRMSSRDWRRAYVTPFEPLAIKRAFHVAVAAANDPAACDGGAADTIAKLSRSAAKTGGVDSNGGEKAFGGDDHIDDCDGSALRPPPPSPPLAAAGRTQSVHRLSQSQATQYARLLEELLREVQSPVFPLLVPVARSGNAPEATDRKRTTGVVSAPDTQRLNDSSEPSGGGCNTEVAPRADGELVVDVNTSLLAPNAIAQSGATPDQVLLWFFQLGLLLGLAWRGSVLLPLQFTSSEFWRDVVAPKSVRSDEPTEEGDDRRQRDTCALEAVETRLAIFQAVREGLFAVVPSCCVSLFSPLEVRSRLSDPNDVTALETLQSHAEYDPELRHHAMFWELVAGFTAVERRALLLFLTNSAGHSRSSVSRQGRSGTTAEATSADPPPFVLEMSGDALADSQSHPDACYPVVVAVAERRCRLHLPVYTTTDAMRKKLTLAMTAGDCYSPG
ncbi:hypothetical protein PybrP1_006518 [[Pythium] brassicae (nom. inval.)]|nr:hypothetical protein PybrP1_006518 [[Pythium] brassicae (nom. inval.)]